MLIRKLIVVASSFLLVICSYAQSAPKLEWDLIEVGVGIPFGASNQNSALTLGTEIRYNIAVPLSIGVGVSRFNFGSNLADSNKGASYILRGKMDYYHNEGPNRFFTGFGILAIIQGSENLITGIDGSSLPLKNGSGIEVELGGQFNHFRISTSYVLSFDEDIINFFNISLGYTYRWF